MLTITIQTHLATSAEELRRTADYLHKLADLSEDSAGEVNLPTAPVATAEQVKAAEPAKRRGRPSKNADPAPLPRIPVAATEPELDAPTEPELDAPPATHDDVRVLIGKLSGLNARAEAIGLIRSYKDASGKQINAVADIPEDLVGEVAEKLTELLKLAEVSK